MSPEYNAARKRLSELASIYIAAVNDFGLSSPEASEAYAEYESQLKYFQVFSWL
jgi:hypothetical protein